MKDRRREPNVGTELDEPSSRTNSEFPFRTNVRTRSHGYNLRQVSEPAYKRILLKLSGEALMGDQAYGVDPIVATRIAADIAELQSLGVQASIVIGGGNIFRGLAASTRGMDRSTADYMGMLATVINALALQDALEKQNVSRRGC